MKIPSRWQKCPRQGDVIMNKFVPFKTPLDSRYNCDLDPKDYFDVHDILNNNASLNIGMIINLTKSYSYYTQSSVEDNLCQYRKIICAGFENPPDPTQVQEFCEICQEFFEENPDRLIAVHCTHGFNRTGFMIISYLVLVEHLTLKAAYSLFKLSRQPGIYKSSYTRELNSRFSHTFTQSCDYNGTKLNCEVPVIEMCPPNWDNINSVVKNSTSSNDGDDFVSVNKSSSSKSLLNVPSITCPETIYEIRSSICQLAGIRSNAGFPGGQPVSLDHQNIAQLKLRPYKVSWKADGMRLLLYIKGPSQIYAADRDFTLFMIGDKISFYKKNDLDVHLTDTLLDGELVIDKIVNKMGVTEEIPRYLAYDIIVFQSKYVGSLTYEQRLAMLHHEIEMPRRKLIYEKKIDRAKEIFGFRLKAFYDVSQSSRLLSEEFQKTIAHGTDGLIFQCNEQPYTLFTNPYLLKWKPPELNSIDFLLQIQVDGGVGKIPQKRAFLLLSSNSHSDGFRGPAVKYQIFAEMKYTKNLNEMNNKIVECVYDQSVDKGGNRWSILRIRHDKSFPNHINVGQSILKTIYHPIDKQTLLNYLNSG